MGGDCKWGVIVQCRRLTITPHNTKWGVIVQPRTCLTIAPHSIQTCSKEGRCTITPPRGGGRLYYGSDSNLFWLKGGVVYVPPEWHVPQEWHPPGGRASAPQCLPPVTSVMSPSSDTKDVPHQWHFRNIDFSKYWLLEFRNIDFSNLEILIFRNLIFSKKKTDSHEIRNIDFATRFVIANHSQRASHDKHLGRLPLIFSTLLFRRL